MNDENTFSNRNAGVSRQVIATLVASCLCAHMGLYGGWVSPMTLVLRGKDSPVGTMSKQDIANLASAPTYVALIYMALMGFVAKKFGRKVSMHIIGFCGICNGILQTFATAPWMLFTSRIIGVATYTGIPISAMYVSEYAHESIRGMLMSVCAMVINVGILMAYTLGKLLPYKWFNSIYIVFPIIYSVFLFFLPESPHFLVDKSRVSDAEKSLLWFRGGDAALARRELDIIQEAKGQQHEALTISQILRSKSMRSALVISVMLYGFQTMSGIQAILNYAALIFEEAGSLLSPEDSSIIVASLLLGAAFLNVLLIERLGRKPLLIFSFVGCAINMAGLTIFLFLQMKKVSLENFTWVPIMTVGLFVVCYGVGVATVPGALTNEVSPTSIRPIVGSLVGVTATLIMLLVIQSFPFLDDEIGLYSAFAIPTVFNVLGMFYTIAFIPETKGKSFAEIERELENR